MVPNVVLLVDNNSRQALFYSKLRVGYELLNLKIKLTKNKVSTKSITYRKSENFDSGRQKNKRLRIVDPNSS